MSPPQRKTLARSVSFRDYLSIGLGSIIGVGWILVAGEWLTRGGPLGTSLAFLVGGLLFISVGKCYAELTPALPLAGGEVAFAYKTFGTRFAFLTGWMLAFGYVTLGPFETTSLGWLFEFLVPSLRSAPLYEVGGFGVGWSSILPGVVIGLFVMYINYRGVKNSATFQLISTVVLLSCALIFTVIAFSKGSVSNLRPLFSDASTWTGSLSGIIAVLAMVPWFLSGFDAIPQAAEESGTSVNPSALGWAVILSIVGGTLFYAIVTVAISTTMPWQQAAELEMPPVQVFTEAFGMNWVSTMVLCTGFLGLVTSFNGIFLASTRLLFACGRGGLLPAWFGVLDPKHKTPRNAILFSGAVALAGPFLGKAILIPIVDVGSFGFVISMALTCFAAIRLRKTAPELHRPYRVKHLYTLYLGLFVSVALILTMIIPGSPAELAWPSEHMILAGWMVLGFAGYLFRLRQADMTEEERAIQILGDYR